MQTPILPKSLLKRIALQKRLGGRCVDCRTPCAPTHAAHLRCPICELRFQRRIKYVNEITRARSRYLDRCAQELPRQSHHCPQCNHFRRNSDFIRGSGLLGACSICRDEAYNQAQRKESVKRYVARAIKKSAPKSAAEILFGSFK